LAGSGYDIVNTSMGFDSMTGVSADGSTHNSMQKQVKAEMMEMKAMRQKSQEGKMDQEIEMKLEEARTQGDTDLPRAADEMAMQDPATEIERKLEEAGAQGDTDLPAAADEMAMQDSAPEIERKLEEAGAQGDTDLPAAANEMAMQDPAPETERKLEEAGAQGDTELPAAANEMALPDPAPEIEKKLEEAGAQGVADVPAAADDVAVQDPAPAEKIQPAPTKEMQLGVGPEASMDDMGWIKLQGDKMPLDLDEEDEEDEAEKIQPAPTEEPLLLQPSADLTLMSPSSSNNAAQVEVHVADEIAHV